MSGPGDVPPEVLTRLRPIFSRLPESYEEPAWIGVRWRIRKRTIAHVYTPDPDRSPFYARYAAGGEPPTVMTFRVPMDDLLGLTAEASPYFRAPWGHNVAATILGPHTNWPDLTDLLTDSYREQSPKSLSARLTPTDPPPT